MVFPLIVPRRRTFNLHAGASATFSVFTILRLNTNEGVTGYGEATTRVRSLYMVMEDFLLDLGVAPPAFVPLNVRDSNLNIVLNVVDKKIVSWLARF